MLVMKSFNTQACLVHTGYNSFQHIGCSSIPEMRTIMCGFTYCMDLEVLLFLDCSVMLYDATDFLFNCVPVSS